MLGVVLDAGSLDRGDIDYRSLKETIPQWRMYEETRPQELAERIRDASVVVSNKVVLDRTALESAERLELICVAATGTNNVDLDAANRLGIPVCNVRAYATHSVVQHTFGLLLSLATRVSDYARAVREGRWSNSAHFCLLEFPVSELAGKTMGIIGYGELGQAVGNAARCFGLTVMIAERAGQKARPGRIELDRVLRESDVITLHAPLTAETDRLIGRAQLDQMKRDAILINTARGGLVDEAALARALRNGQLGGAGVDVFSREPPPADHPLLADDIPNLIVTPHVAWASVEARRRLVDEVTQNIQAWLAGQPRNIVTG